MSRLFVIGAITLLAALAIYTFAPAGGGTSATGHIVIDTNGPKSPWGKTVGDIDGDGRPDILVGGHQRNDLSLMTRVLRKMGLVDTSGLAGDLVWYRNPTWEKHLISGKDVIHANLI